MTCRSNRRASSPILSLQRPVSLQIIADRLPLASFAAPGSSNIQRLDLYYAVSSHRIEYECMVHTLLHVLRPLDPLLDLNFVLDCQLTRESFVEPRSEVIVS